MATYKPLYNLPEKFKDNSGDPLTSGTLEFYLAGTTTATDLFGDSSGTSIGTSITLNSWGMPESGGNTITLFRDQSKALKVVGKNAAGATIFTSDNIPAVASFDSTASAKLATIEENADVTDATNVAAAGAYMKDGSAALTGDLYYGAAIFDTGGVTTGIVASVTQTQAGATALTSRINNVATVASANDAVVLPAAKVGRRVTVMNNGANVLQVFPASSDAIDSGAADASTTQAAGQNAEYIALDATTWEKSPYTEPADANAYGIMSAQGASTAESTTDATPRKIAGFDTDGISSNVTVDSTTDNDLTATVAGIYYAKLEASFSGTASKTFLCEIYKNASATGFSFTRKLGTGGDVGSASCSGIISLAANDTVSAYHSSTDGGTAFTLVDGQLFLEKIASA
jgi:hypothetical protein